MAASFVSVNRDAGGNIFSSLSRILARGSVKAVTNPNTIKMIKTGIKAGSTASKTGAKISGGVGKGLSKAKNYLANTGTGQKISRLYAKGGKTALAKAAGVKAAKLGVGVAVPLGIQMAANKLTAKDAKEVAGQTAMNVAANKMAGKKANVKQAYQQALASRYKQKKKKKQVRGARRRRQKRRVLGYPAGYGRQWGRGIMENDEAMMLELQRQQQCYDDFLTEEDGEEDVYLSDGGASDDSELHPNEDVNMSDREDYGYGDYDYDSDDFSNDDDEFESEELLQKEEVKQLKRLQQKQQKHDGKKPVAAKVKRKKKAEQEMRDIFEDASTI